MQPSRCWALPTSLAARLVAQAAYCMYKMLCSLSQDETVDFTMGEEEFKTLFKQEQIKLIEILGIRLYSGAPGAPPSCRSILYCRT